MKTIFLTLLSILCIECVAQMYSVRGRVDVDNTVDINIDEVMGYMVGCHYSYTIDGKSYKAIDVYSR